jgi:hypothetical protein
MTAKSNAMSAVLRTAAHRAIAAHEAVGNIAKQTPDDTEPFHIALDARNDAIVALGRTVLNILLAGGEVDCSLDAAQNGTPVIATSRMALAAEPGDPAIVMQTPAAPATVVRRKRGASPSWWRVVAPSAARASLQPASSDQLERLSGSGLGPNWSETSADNNPEAWKAAVDLFGPPPEVSDIISYDKALRRLVRGVQVDDWRSYPRDLQKSLVGYASSLSRFLQDEAGPAIGLSHPPHELSTMFSVMTRYSDVERPGFVSGLSRRNPPEYGTWALDCDWWWTRLQRLIGEDDESEPSAVDKTKAWAQLTEVLTEGSESEALLNALRSLRMAGVSSDDKRLLDVMFPHAHLLEGVTAFKTLRKKLLRMADVEEDVVEAEDHTSPVPEDWPYSRARSTSQS